MSSTATHITFEHCEFRIYADGDNNNFIMQSVQLDKDSLKKYNTADPRDLLQEQMKLTEQLAAANQQINLLLKEQMILHEELEIARENVMLHSQKSSKKHNKNHVKQCIKKSTEKPNPNEKSNEKLNEKPNEKLNEKPNESAE